MKELLSIVKTVLLSIIGVGSKKSLAGNFARAEGKSPWPYILVGLAAVIIFVLLILLIVKIVLS